MLPLTIYQIRQKTIDASSGSTPTFDFPSCFDARFYYEIILNNVIIENNSEGDCYLRAKFYVQFQGGAALDEGPYYNTQNMSGDAGDSGVANITDNGFHLWSQLRQGPASGIFGKISVFQTHGDFKKIYIANLYAAEAYHGVGCQIYSTGSYLGAGRDGAFNDVVGIKFEAYNKKTDEYVNFVAGTISIYGYSFTI